MSSIPRVPIPDRGGNEYAEGTVYYSRTDKVFYAAGRESEGPLSVNQVSGKVFATVSDTGVARYRDQTGTFIPTGVFRPTSGVTFGSGFLQVHEVISHPDIGTPAPPDGQWVERVEILIPQEPQKRPDGSIYFPPDKVKVIEVNHGIGNDFDPQTQSKQWWRKVKTALEEETGTKASYNEVKAAIQSRATILRLNLGPIGQE
jgi:hypothetical protein